MLKARQNFSPWVYRLLVTNKAVLSENLCEGQLHTPH